ncbi:MAG TPA: hypothetical protein IAB49_00170 [Candidatus Caccenecus avistercoris]|nr:hypothetical protein [Candidatus Caccenecus avistercoris]
MTFETLKRSHLKRNIIIALIAIGIISAIVLNFTRAKYRTTQSMPLLNGTINYTLADLNIVAMYLDGSEIDTLPDGNYALTSESYCTTEDDVKDESITLSYDSATKGLSVSPMTKKGTKCYLYFEEKSGASDIIEDAYEENQGMLAYDGTVDNNLRYIGANPNNYVYFNCDDYNNPSSSTCELWRIIGVFNENSHGISGEKLVKLIRSNSLGDIVWDSDGTNNWSTASLQTTLNGDYLNDSGSYAATGIKNNTTRNMIANVTWKLGGTASYTSASNGLASHWYGYERGTTVYSGRPTTWQGKIALMYPSDYGYATSGGSTTNREACLAKELYNWESSSYSDCKNNDWIFNNDYQWTLTPYSRDIGNIFLVYPSGYVNSDGRGDDSNGVRPSVYLTSNVGISGGDGTMNNPYILKA